MRFRRGDGGAEANVEIIALEGGVLRVRIDRREVAASFEPAAGGGLMITLGGRRERVFALKLKERILVAAGPAAFEFTEVRESRPSKARGPAAPEVTAPMPGKVLRILVCEGQTVGPGDALVVLEAMKMETTLSAETPARIKRVTVAEGQMVDHGAVLLELAPVTLAPPSRDESGPQDL